VLTSSEEKLVCIIPLTLTLLFKVMDPYFIPSGDPWQKRFHHQPPYGLVVVG
jgi:hypothetical protein